MPCFCPNRRLSTNNTTIIKKQLLDQILLQPNSGLLIHSLAPWSSICFMLATVLGCNFKSECLNLHLSLLLVSLPRKTNLLWRSKTSFFMRKGEEEEEEEERDRRRRRRKWEEEKRSARHFLRPGLHVPFPQSGGVSRDEGMKDEQEATRWCSTVASLQEGCKFDSWIQGFLGSCGVPSGFSCSISQG